MTSLLDIYVHYKKGPTGQLGLRVAGFPGHWVAGSQNVKRNVFSRDLKTVTESLLTTVLGSEFQTAGAERR